MIVSRSTFRDYIIAIICSIACCILLSVGKLDDSYSTIIGRFSVVVIVWCGWSMAHEQRSWFNLIFMFEISYYLFTLGQSFLKAINVEIPLYNMYLREPVNDVNRAYVYSIFCLVWLHIGAITYVRRKRLKKIYTRHWEEISNIADVQSMRTIALIALPFSMVAYGIEAFQLFRVYLSSGYAAAYSSISGTSSWAKIPSYIADYFPFVLFMLYIACEDNKQVRRIATGLIVLTILFNFAIGNRSEPICYSVALLWLRQKRSGNESAKIKSYVLTAIVLIAIIIIIPVIGSTRNTGELNMSAIIGAFTGEDSFLYTISETISSLGYSVFPTIKTMQMIPEQFNFHYGQSYFFALLSVFPNIFGGTHISQKYAALAQWLMKTLNMTTGPGYSLPAEAYYNFGLYGVLIMPLLGGVFAKFLHDSDDRDNKLRMFVVVGSFIVLFSIPRRDMLTTIRNLAYLVGLLYVAVRFLAKRQTIQMAKSGANGIQMDQE